MANNIQKLPLIGAHCSISGGFFKAIQEAVSIGANCLQIFTANQRQWRSKSISHDQIKLWENEKYLSGIFDVASHASYLINLGSDNPEVVQKSIFAIRDEIIRCQLLDIKILNFHPGSHKSLPIEQSIEQIISSLKQCLDLFQEKSFPVMCLETTAGQGSQIGKSFEELMFIINGVKDHIPIGCCIDTCHIYSAGYDIKKENGLEETLNEFEKLIPLETIKLIHINDSKGACGSKIDRHASLGYGNIGLELFENIIRNKRLYHVPKVLETPGDNMTWEEEIKILQSFN